MEKEPHILGSIEHDPKFKTVGPEGAILVGLEARFGKFGNTDIVRAVRPIYRVKGTEEFGQQFGNDLGGRHRRAHADGIRERRADLLGRHHRFRRADVFRRPQYRPGRSGRARAGLARCDRLLLRLEVQDARKEAIDQREQQQGNAGCATEAVLLA